MNLLETILIGLRGVTANRLRSGLTVLGILIGVAAVKPAEFVIFRVGQKTADARS